MKLDEAMYLIHQNGIGQNIECFFVSKGADNKEYSSIVVNYKYQKGQIKIYLDRYQLKMHSQNLVKSPYFEFRIKEKNSSILRLMCRSSLIEDKFIHASVLKVKYQNDDGEEIYHRIITN
jgi:hypothetical protein